MKRRGFILGAVAAVVGAVVGRAKPAMSASLNYGKADKVVTYARYWCIPDPKAFLDEVNGMRGFNGTRVSSVRFKAESDGSGYGMYIDTDTDEYTAKVFLDELTRRLNKHVVAVR